MKIQVKRIYESPAAADGYRILVDRLWPRGITKEAAALDRWMKAVAPSDELRKWFHAHMEQWDEFRKRYVTELKDTQALKELRSLAAESEVVTLLVSAKTIDRNQAIVLKQILEEA